ncbi:MAG: hypothetical protein ACI90M_004845, partial [Candidatus Azotimanducaceae bacterium]
MHALRLAFALALPLAVVYAQAPVGQTPVGQAPEGHTPVAHTPGAQTLQPQTPVTTWLAQNGASLDGLYVHLHQNPELSFREVKTAA